MHHHITREVIAALGGILFIIFGVTRRQERLRLIRTGGKTESNMLWVSLVAAGTCLLIFAVGLLMYQLNRDPG